MYAALLLQVIWTPEVDLNGYPRISNPYCCDIKFEDVSGPKAKNDPKVNHRLKEVKEALVATHHTFTTAYFDNMWDNMWVQFFLGKKLMNILISPRNILRGIL